MALKLEERVEALEKQVAALTALPATPAPGKDWRRTVGVFRDDPVFEEASQLGREYREQQTYQKEIAGS